MKKIIEKATFEYTPENLETWFQFVAGCNSAKTDEVTDRVTHQFREYLGLHIDFQETCLPMTILNRASIET